MAQAGSCATMAGMISPELLAKLHGEGYIRAVKEFSGDVRRAYQLAELAPLEAQREQK